MSPEHPQAPGRKPRLAIVSFHFPPISAIGAARPLRLANHAASQGWEVSVLACSPHSARLFEPVDPDSGRRCDPSVKVTRVYTLHAFTWLLRAREAWRKRKPASPPAAPAAPGYAASAPEGAGKAAAAGDAAAPRGTLKSLLDAFQHLCEVPDRYMSFILLGLPLLALECLRRRPDALYVTSPPWSPMVLATLASRLFGIPLTIDYRDPWNFNPYGSSKRHPRLRLALEMRALKAARTVIFNTEAMRRHYLAKLPWLAAKSCAVYNGVDESLIKEVEQVRQAVPPPSGGLTLVHAGYLYPERMPAGLARSLASASKDWDGGGALRFRFVGTVERPGDLTAAFEAAGAADRLSLAGHKPARQARLEQAMADCILVLQLGTTIQLPGKIFECALLAKPILCVAEADSETADVVRKYGLGEVVSEWRDPAAIAAALARLIREWTPGKAELERLKRDFSGPALAAEMLRRVGQAV